MTHKDASIPDTTFKDLPAWLMKRYPSVEPMPLSDHGGHRLPVPVCMSVRIVHVGHWEVIDVAKGRREADFLARECGHAFEAAIFKAEQLGLPWRVAGGTELFDPKTKRCWSARVAAPEALAA